MLEAAKKAVSFGEGRSCEDLEKDEKLALALTRLLEIVGEAAKHVPPEVTARYPDVPWSKAAGLRDRVIHRYFEVDLGIIVNIIREDLPPLIGQLEQVLEESRSGDEEKEP